MEHSIDLKTFGARLAARRKVKNLTQKRLGEMVSVSPQVIHNLEVGANKKLDPETLKGLCFVLQCTSDYLFGLSQNPDKTKDELIEAVRYAPESMAGYATESKDLLFQDRELAKLMFECSKRLPKKDMKLLKEIIDSFLRANPAKPQIGSSKKAIKEQPPTT